MTFEVSTVPAFLDAFRTQLVARAGLDGVTVTTALRPAGSVGESIEFDTVENDEEWATLGNQRKAEVYIVTGQIYADNGGNREADAKAARDRAYAIFDEVTTQLREDTRVSSTVRLAEMIQHTLTQGVTDKGRWANIRFQIRLTGDLKQT